MKTKETELEILLLLNMIKNLGIPKAAVGNIILCHPEQMINAIQTHRIKYPPIQHSMCNSFSGLSVFSKQYVAKVYGQRQIYVSKTVETSLVYRHWHQGIFCNC